MYGTIIITEICADPAVKSGKTYGGYLVSEISSISGASCITTVNDYIRLISPNEYTTLKTKVSDTSWLYTAGSWFTMGAYSGIMASHVQSVYVITYDGTLGNHFSSRSYIVRPVITIKKS